MENTKLSSKNRDFRMKYLINYNQNNAEGFCNYYIIQGLGIKFPFSTKGKKATEDTKTAEKYNLADCIITLINNKDFFSLYKRSNPRIKIYE